MSISEEQSQSLITRQLICLQLFIPRRRPFSMKRGKCPDGTDRSTVGWVSILVRAGLWLSSVALGAASFITIPRTGILWTWTEVLISSVGRKHIAPKIGKLTSLRAVSNGAVECFVCRTSHVRIPDQRPTILASSNRPRPLPSLSNYVIIIVPFDVIAQSV